MAQMKTVALSDLPQRLDACFTEAVSGNLVRVTHADQEVILIGKDTFRLITECLQSYHRSLDRLS